MARNNRQANTELRKTGSSAVANAGGASPAHRSLVFGAIIVGVITFIAFLPALSNQFVDWDDPDNFLRNTHFRGLGWENIKWMFSTFRMGHYQPLTWLTLGLDSVIGESLYGNELDPRPYHFTNVVLHAVNAALVFVLALRLLQRAGWTSPRGLIIGAMFAGLFFGVHPLRVESVAWATERRDLLSALFILMAVLAYLRANRPDQHHRSRWIWITLLAFTLSLLSKVIGVTLPVVLLILDWYPLRRLDASPLKWLESPSRQALLEKLPFFALSLVFSVVATVGQAANQWLTTMQVHPPAARIMQSFYGLGFYIWKTVAPTNLLPLYQMRLPLDYTSPQYLVIGGLVIAAVVVIIALRRRAPWLLAAAAIYAVMLGPVLGVIQNGPQIVADRYSYLSCIPWAVLAGAAIVGAIESSSALVRTLAFVLPSLVVAVLGTLTWRQSQVWRTTESLWTHTYRGDPAGSFAMNGYGYVLLNRGEFNEAIGLFRAVLAISPDNGKARVNLWEALERNGHEAALIVALREGAESPTVSYEAHYRIGNILLGQRKFAEAAAEFRAALQARPGLATAHTNLGVALQNLGEQHQAIQEYRLAIAADPNLYQPRLHLAVILRSQGQTALAIEQFREVLRLKPDHPAAAANLKELTGEPR